MMLIASYILAFVGGIVFASFVRWLGRKRKYSGIMYVSESEGKTLYSLELDDYPEKLAFKKEVAFQVNRVDRE